MPVRKSAGEIAAVFNIVVLVGFAVTAISIFPVLKQLQSHPGGLKVLFFAEMWERFSYYGMRGLLIFYLTQHFLFNDGAANARYAAYTSLVYLLPLIGGLVADKFIGTRKAIAFGALLLVAGHFLMGVEGAPARQHLLHQGHAYEILTVGRGDARTVQIVVDGQRHDLLPSDNGGFTVTGVPPSSPIATLRPGAFETAVTRDDRFTHIFEAALSLIILGVGFMKPNISTLVGQLYPARDPRRDPGFTLYYYGINLGSFWAAVLCGLIGQEVGWWAGFALAGVGMLGGYVVFVSQRRSLEGHGEPPAPEALRRRIGPLRGETWIYITALASLPLIWLLVQRNATVGWILGSSSVLVLGYLAWFMGNKCSALERGRLALALILVSGAVVFFTLFEQAGTSLNLFAARNTQLPSDGVMTVTASQVQSFNAGFLLLLAPIFSALWAWLERRGRDLDPVLKFGLGLIQVGAGFLILVWGAMYADAGWKVPLVFVALCYFLHTTGELCLSPVGLSQITKLAPTELASTLMAVWFLSSSWAQWVGGLIAQFAGSETVGGQVSDPQAALAASSQVFAMLGWSSAAIGLLFAMASPWLKRMAHGASDAQPGAISGAAMSDPASGPKLQSR